MRRILLVLILLATVASIAHAACQVLIVRNNDPGDSTNTWRWQRGYPVVVRDGAWTWGREEDPRYSNTFVIVTISNLSQAQVQPVLEAIQDSVDGKWIRRYHFLLKNVPLWVRQSLADSGRVTVTYAQIKAYVKNQRTGASW